MAAEERIIPAAVFRDQCLRLMDEINETGDRLIVTKHGNPVAVVGPARRDAGSLWGFMEGTTRILGDIDAPAIAEQATLATTDGRILEWAERTNALAVLDATE